MEIPFQYLLRHGKVDSLVLDKSVYIKDMLVLPNNLIVVASMKSLTLYDENFKLIQSIETINGEKLFPYAIEFDESEKCLYMSDWLNGSIFKIDLHFVLIKMIHFKRYTVTTNNQLGIYFYRIQDLSLCQKHVVSSCDGISVINSSFYISNYTQNTIHCFNENGSLKEVIKLGCIRRYIGHSCTFAKLNNDLLMKSMNEICKFRK